MVNIHNVPQQTNKHASCILYHAADPRKQEYEQRMYNILHIHENKTIINVISNLK